MVILGKDSPFGSLFGTVLAKKSRSRTPSSRRSERWRRSRRRRRVRTGRSVLQELAHPGPLADIHAFCSNYRLNVCAPTDDKPFFFNMKRFGDLGHLLGHDYISSVDPMLILVLTLLILLVMSGAALVLPLRLVRGGPARPSASCCSLSPSVWVSCRSRSCSSSASCCSSGFPRIRCRSCCLRCSSSLDSALTSRAGGRPRSGPDR